MRAHEPEDRAEDAAAAPLAGGAGSQGGAEGQGTFPVVGVGASAGGLEAFSGLLKSLPADPGLAIVLIQHLEPSHESDLAEILGRTSRMPVVQVGPGMQLEVDHVYVIPPNVEMRVEGNALELTPRPAGDRPSMTVDIFLTSLAEQYGSAAIGVVLSGTATDGTRGLAAIRAEGGVTLVQDPDEAKHRGMPASAVDAGVADLVLPVEQIARELGRLAKHPNVRRTAAAPAEPTPEITPDVQDALDGIVAEMRRSTGLDLSHYKRPTILRRVRRRMIITQADTMADYANLLIGDGEEVRRLLDEVLVRVTSFFRDAEAFEALGEEVVRIISVPRKDGATLRAWVPGCATGQEAYSVAMVLFERLESAGSNVAMQIFATDLREEDLAFARRGVYPREIAAEVGPERLARFFVEVEDGYRVIQTIRDACLFARHDVTKDPPFGHLDLVSCRNLLIYLDKALQETVLSIFHYALEPDGLLMLGQSEGVSAAPGLFKRGDHPGIFRRLAGPTPTFVLGRPIGAATSVAQAIAPLSARRTQEAEWSEAQHQLDDLLLEKYAPSAVLIDDEFQVRQIRGEAGQYLQFRPGDASLDLGSMVSPGFSSAVSAAIAEVRETGRPAHRQAVRPKPEGGHASVMITVVPILIPDGSRSYAILFEEGEAVSLAPGQPGTAPTEADYLRQELDASLEKLRIMHYNRDEANETLRAANEEIQSSNEELQSMNEELETAKEELQSANEELRTLNDELQSRNAELVVRNDDLNNLLASAATAMLVIDSDLKIRRYTAQAGHLFNLIPGDIGRRVTDIRWKVNVEDIPGLLSSVMASGKSDEREVQDDDGCWFRMTTRPYLDDTKRPRGLVLTLIDIDVLHRAAVPTV